jgi:ubiquinone/menaquinone biosynthesis C-methylase UbiE
MTKTEPSEVNSYSNPDYALSYLAKSDDIPHRTDGEAVVLELLPESVRRILDLGTGDGRLMWLAKLARPLVRGVATDISPAMLEKARSRFKENKDISVVDHDLNDSLPDMGNFDVVLSCFSIHHVSNERKQALYSEIFAILEPGGIFCNLEHVSSPTPKLHEAFYHALGATLSDEDPSNQCASVEIQLGWLRRIGFEDVDCYWKWRELALLAGLKPRQ